MLMVWSVLLSTLTASVHGAAHDGNELPAPSVVLVPGSARQTRSNILGLGSCSKSMWRQTLRASSCLEPDRGRIKPECMCHQDVVARFALDSAEHCGVEELIKDAAVYLRFCEIMGQRMEIIISNDTCASSCERVRI